MAKADVVYRFPREIAEEAGAWLLRELGQVCEEVVIAGSTRRGRERVKDLEIVLLPNASETWRVACSRVDGALLRLISEGVLSWDTHTKRRGERYKRLLIELAVLGIKSAERYLPVDLFLGDRENFGNQVVIRTGPWDWNRAIFGLMYRRNRMHDAGYMYEAKPSDQEDCFVRGDMISCRTEAAFFKEIGLVFVPPPLRSEENAGRAWYGQPLRDPQTGEIVIVGVSSAADQAQPMLAR